MNDAKVVATGEPGRGRAWATKRAAAETVDLAALAAALAAEALIDRGVTFRQ